MILALLAAFAPQLSAADEQKAADKLLTRYFWVAPSLMSSGTEEGIAESWFGKPIIFDELEDNEMTRKSSARQFLEASGVTFPPGAAAVYYGQHSFLGVKNTAENLRLVSEIMKVGRNEEPPMLHIEVRVVEYTPDVETKLAGRGTFADLEAKLGESVKTVSASSVTTGSGQHAEGRLDSGTAKTNSTQKPTGKTKRAVEESETWPPPAGVQGAKLTIAATLMDIYKDNQLSADMEIGFWFAAPAGSGQPAMRTELQTNLTIRDGAIVVAKTFTISDPANKRPAPRRYAVLVSFNKVNPEGKTTEQLREEIAKKLKKPKQP